MKTRKCGLCENDIPIDSLYIDDDMPVSMCRTCKRLLRLKPAGGYEIYIIYYRDGGKLSPMAYLDQCAEIIQTANAEDQVISECVECGKTSDQKYVTMWTIDGAVYCFKCASSHIKARSMVIVPRKRITATEHTDI